MSRFKLPKRDPDDKPVHGTSEGAARRLEDSERARRMAAQRTRSLGLRPPPRRRAPDPPVAPDPEPIHPDGLRAVAAALGRPTTPYIESPSDQAWWARAEARLAEIAAENERRREAG